MPDSYDDIIDLPHHVSTTRVRMSAADRAAQFSPFAALTGFGAAINETGRLTERRRELDENEKSALDEKLRAIAERPEAYPETAITYFVPDARKDGGAYVTETGEVRRIDPHERVVVMTRGARIPIDDILRIEI